MYGYEKTESGIYTFAIAAISVHPQILKNAHHQKVDVQQGLFEVSRSVLAQYSTLFIGSSPNHIRVIKKGKTSEASSTTRSIVLHSSLASVDDRRHYRQ